LIAQLQDEVSDFDHNSSATVQYYGAKGVPSVVNPLLWDHN
jgi:hypothetical protein